MRSDPSDNGGLFVGRRPGTAPVRFRTLPERGSEPRQRVDGSLAQRCCSRRMIAPQPALLGADPARLPVARLAGRLPLRQRQPRHPGRVRRAVRAAVRRAASSCAASTRRGSSCAAPPATTSARARSGGSSRSPPSSARPLRVWFLRHPRPRLEHRLGQSGPDASIGASAQRRARRAARTGRSGPARLLPPVRRDVRGGGQRGPARGGRGAQAQSAHPRARRSTCRTPPGPSCPTRGSSTRSPSSRAAACTATRICAARTCAASSPSATASTPPA